jgi:alkylation response protein AidB-like acyl-CoA dehydrogenase
VTHAVERTYSSDVGAELVELVRSVARDELAPHAAAAEAAAEFPREAFRTLGKAGLLALPYPEEHGGGGLPFHDYLQVLEELSAAWGSVGLGVSVHTLACFPLALYGTQEQKQRWLPPLLSGDTLGAYCLSETDSGSDAASLRTRADRDGTHYVLNGTKAWISHGGVADFYAVMARTSDEGARGISCFLVDADSPGLRAAEPEHKLGFTASPTAQVRFEGVRVPVERRIGDEGQGFAIAMAALDSGRLGIAACAVGIAQAALDLAVDYAKERKQFGQRIADFQGLSFLLADMATSVAAARELYLAAARRRDEGQVFATQASMAKLFATDVAMQVTTDAIQVLGGAGYVRDFPAERYFREAKALQIVEGTNQIQRMVIGRALTRPDS